MSTFIQANSKFCVDLFKTLAEENPKKNVFFSPISVSAALAMVLFGARGETAKQMEKALRFDEVTGSGSSPPAAGAQCDTPGGLHTQFKELMAAINTHTKNYALYIANRLYGAEQYEFHQQYLRCTKELYGAELERADFQRSPEEGRKKINSWVEGRTNGKIKNVLAPGSVDTSTTLVLVNAIYFKGKWNRGFKKMDTKEATFWISQSQSKNVPMMHQKDVFRWAEIQNPPMQMVELIYDHGDQSMIVMLPHDKEGLDQLQKEVTYPKLEECMSIMQEQKMDVGLPKFKVEGDYTLSAPLQALGMKDAFTKGKADLTGMSESRDLFVSAVVHKAYVEVNEEGTEAAAATGVTAETTSAGPVFIADHPFLFIIRHNKTQSILFLGTVRDP
ncbi:UNVERIFIED_CONTAM: hypothetical protein K2H54_058428 [Gekko kuhli]